jgi:hypothetical protein
VDRQHSDADSDTPIFSDSAQLLEIPSSTLWSTVPIFLYFRKPFCARPIICGTAAFFSNLAAITPLIILYLVGSSVIGCFNSDPDPARAQKLANLIIDKD